MSEDDPTSLASIPVLGLPCSLTNRMDRPLVIFLGQNGAIQDKLLFLDCHHSICTSAIPSSILQEVEVSSYDARDLARDTVSRTDSQASTLRNDLPHTSKDSFDDKSIVAHYSLPEDWISPDCVALIQAVDNGTLLCPCNGEVAVVQYAGFIT